MEMFNACDSCKPWSEKQTVLFLNSLDNIELPFYFESYKSVVLLKPKFNNRLFCHNYLALYFEDRYSCIQALSNFKVKCQLSIISGPSN